MVDVIFKAKATDSLPDLADSVETQAYVDRYGGFLTQSILADYAAAAWRGIVYTGCTATTGVAPGTTISTTTPFTLANPAGSGVLLIPIDAMMAYVSGTLGTGTTYLTANTNPIATAVSGTAITVTKTKLSVAGAAQGNRGLAFTTATVPATPTVLAPFCSLTPILATSVTQPYVVEKELKGKYVVAEGCALNFSSLAAAGTSPLVIFGMSWIEVPA